MPSRPALALSIVAVLLAADAHAQAPAPPEGGWVGKRVITQYGAVLNDPRTGKLDDADRAKNVALTGKERSDFRTYKVEHVNGNWLWLHDERSSAEGWVDASWVVPFDQAVDFYTAQIRANPSASNYNSRANVWKAKGEFDIAIADLNEAIRLDPSDAIYYVGRGRSWSSKKDHDKAISDYSEAIRLDPKYVLAYRNRGAVWHAKNEFDKAITDCTEAIRLDPKDATAYFNRGCAWDARKEYDKAIADYDETIRLDPKFAMAYSNRAWLRATCPEAKYRDGKAAVADATRACGLSEWKEAYLIVALAAVYAEVGDFAKAVETQEKAQGLYKEADDIKKGRELLELYKAKKPYRSADGD